MPALWIVFLAAFLPLVPERAAVVQNPVRARYQEALAAAPTEGLLPFVSRLDAAAMASPGAAFTPRLLEMIQVIGLLHPGSVPDRVARFERLSAQGAQTAALVRRIDILQRYFAAAAQGRPELGAAALEDAALMDSSCALQARADAAFRSGDLAGARALSSSVIEADPFSPTLAASYVLLGLCDASAGSRTAAVAHLQRALSVSPLPTIYGRTQDYLAVLSRFVRPTPGPAGQIFAETAAVRLAGVASLKDPRSLSFSGGRFILIDRDQLLGVSMDAKVLETRAARRLEDAATSADGITCYVAEDSVDLGTGMLVKVSATVGGRQKTLGKLRSIAFDPRGDLYLLDLEAGLFRLPQGSTHRTGTGAATPILATLAAPVRGHQLRIDRRGYLYILGADLKSVQVLSAEGKPLTTLAPGGAREPTIEYFALDLLNNVYMLDSGNNSIEVFAAKDAAGRVEPDRLGSVALDPKPSYRNLKVIGVSQTGEVVATGKNDENWVLYR